MRILFAGTPKIALPSFQNLINSSNHEVIGVLARPISFKKTNKPTDKAILELAYKNNITLLQPLDPNSEDFIKFLSELAPDCCVVVAYGVILNKRLLSIPSYGWINLHFSLLPSWRGASPVQATITAGEKLTGVTTFLIKPELDTGIIYGSVIENIYSNETADDLLEKLSNSGASLLKKTLDNANSELLTSISQSTKNVSWASKINSKAARIKWNLPANIIERHIRAFTPYPGAWTIINGFKVKIKPVTLVKENFLNYLAPGEVCSKYNLVFIGTGSYPIQLGKIHFSNRRVMYASEWIRGIRFNNPIMAT